MDVAEQGAWRMIQYHDWTATQVRDWIEESAATAAKLPGGYGPKKSGNCHPEIVREAWKDTVKEQTSTRLVASSFALSRMEAAWSWINALEHEDERRLLYEWAEAKACGKGNLAAVIDRSEYSERTFRRVVARICQRVANTLNRKRAIRLTMPVDVMSEIGDPVSDFSVASSNCAQPRRSPNAERWPGAKPSHDSSPEADASFAKHLSAVNRRRKNQANRRRRQQEARRRKEAA